MNNLSFLLIFLTFLKLIHCLDPRLSFSMLIGNDDESASFENDKGYQNDAIVEINTDCRSADGRFFKDGNQFRTNKTCELCNCEKGSIKCFNQECPNLSCKQQVRLNGECCSICKSTYKVKNENLSCKLSSDVSYKAGAVWHPFIIPLGFDKCTICSCSSKNLAIDCKSICKKKSSKKSRSLFIRRNNFRKMLRSNVHL